jgi:hypothetical protein
MALERAELLFRIVALKGGTVADSCLKDDLTSKHISGQVLLKNLYLHLYPFRSYFIECRM